MKFRKTWPLREIKWQVKLPLVLMDIVMWGLWIGVVVITSPDTWFGVSLFFLTLGAAVLSLVRLFLPWRRSLLISAAMVGILVLRFFQLDQWLNVGLWLGLLAIVELWFVWR